METTVKQRLIYFIKSKGFSQGRFEKEVGLSNGFVNNISKGIGADKLQRILRSFPDLNQSWLLNGEGEMLLPINEMSNNKINASGNSNVSAVYNNGQSINISLPESGTQKIIKPDGSMFMPKISAIDCNVSKPTLKAPFSIRDIACCLVFIFSANSACDIPACSRS